MVFARLLMVASALANLANCTPTPQNWSDWGAPGQNPGQPPPQTPGQTPQSGGVYDAVAAPYLHELALRAGLQYFGTATNQPGTCEDQNWVYQLVLNNSRIFGQLTPANYLKFGLTEPERNQFNFSGGDISVSIGTDNGKLIRCHNLIWPLYNPDWLENGTWTRDELTGVMKNHIYNVVHQYADVCFAWDVVNEALALNGSWSGGVWYDVIGDDWFYLAYQFAQEAVEATGRDIKLYYNDWNIEWYNNKSAGLINRVIPELRRRNIRIDGIGFQTHFSVSGAPTYDQLMDVISRYAAFGLEVAMTELDIRFEIAATARTNTTGLQLQAQRFYDVVKACVDSKVCAGVTLWDFYDYYSWVPEFLAPLGAATPYWEDFSRKPAYYAMADALNGLPCSVCG